jgi:hypothetical protein
MFWGSETAGAIYPGLNSNSCSVDFDFSNMMQLTNYEVKTSVVPGRDYTLVGF